MADHQYPMNRETIKKQNPDLDAADPTVVSPDLDKADLVDLQRIIGNQSVQRMFSQDNAPSPPATFIQTKLAVGPADDKYEQEADSVANQVMSMPDFAQRQEEEEAQPKRDDIQRQDEEELQMKPDIVQRLEEEEEALQGKRDDIQRFEEDEFQLKRDDIQRQPEGEEEEEAVQPKRDDIQRQEVMPEEEDVQAKRDIVQRSGSDGGFDVGGDVEEGIRGAKGGGQALPAETQDFFGSRFGRDFSSVRVHDNSQSESANRSVQARAFTTGKDIFFKGGEYNPGSSSGQNLLAHELTHVVQQNGDEIQRKSPKDKESTKVW